MINFIKVIFEKILSLLTKKTYIQQETILNIKEEVKKDPLVEKLYPGIKEKVYSFIKEAKNINAYLFCGLRTIEEQAELYAKGRTKSGKMVTNAKPGYSYHNYGLAIDMVFGGPGKWTWNSPNWKELGEIGEKYAFEWGGRWTSFPDRPHFQIVFGQSIQDLLKVYTKNNNLQEVWDYLDGLGTTTK